MGDLPGEHHSNESVRLDANPAPQSDAELYRRSNDPQTRRPDFTELPEWRKGHVLFSGKSREITPVSHTGRLALLSRKASGWVSAHRVARLPAIQTETWKSDGCVECREA